MAIQISSTKLRLRSLGYFQSLPTYSTQNTWAPCGKQGSKRWEYCIEENSQALIPSEVSFLRGFESPHTTWWEVLFRIHPITVIVVLNTFLKVMNPEEKLKSQIVGLIGQLTSPKASVYIYLEPSNLAELIPFYGCLSCSAQNSDPLLNFPFICSHSWTTQRFFNPHCQCSSLSQHFPLCNMS